MIIKSDSQKDENLEEKKCIVIQCAESKATNADLIMTNEIQLEIFVFFF